MTFDEWFDNPESLHGNDYFKDALCRAWKAGAKAEREKCAKVCEELPATDPEGPWFNDDMSLASMECAQAIRAMED